MSSVHTIVQGDVFEGFEMIPDGSVQTGISSPPYYWLRKYDAGPREIGLEGTPDEYVVAIAKVMHLAYRKLRMDGTFFLNLGDGYAGSGKGPQGSTGIVPDQGKRQGFVNQKQKIPTGLKNKDLIGIPWRVVFALQGFAVVPIPQLASLCEAIDARDFPAMDAFAAGFKLWKELKDMEWFWHRCDIVWHKPNPLPESIPDRPTRSHEFIFLLAKSGSPLFWTHRELPGVRVKPKPDYRYLDLFENKEYLQPPEGFNSKIKVDCPVCGGTGHIEDPWFQNEIMCSMCQGKGKIKRWARINLWSGHDYYYDPEAIRTNHAEKSFSVHTTPFKGNGTESKGGRFNKWLGDNGKERQLNPGGANRRDVWSISPAQCRDTHFATFPEEIPRLAILAGSSEYGCCPICGAPYTRVIEKGSPLEQWKLMCGADSQGGYNGISWKTEKLKHGKTGHFHRAEEQMKMELAGSHPPNTRKNNLHRKQDAVGKSNYTGFNDRYRAKISVQNASNVKRNVLEGMRERLTIAWRPTCDCGADTAVPCSVLDMFGGKGTTAIVAKELGRSSYLIELNPDYVKMIKKNLRIDERKLTGNPEYRFLQVP